MDLRNLADPKAMVKVGLGIKATQRYGPDTYTVGTPASLVTQLPTN
jgi:hypothetical protein